MLRTDAAKLRWMWIDMRPRWRRRAAVVLTYVVFLVGVWVHPRGSYELFLLIAEGGLYYVVWDPLLKESFSDLTRWVVLGVVYLGGAWLLWWEHSLSRHRPNLMVADLWALVWITLVSALSCVRLVEPVPMRSSVRWWLRQSRRLHTLDEFARHYYGESFATLTEEQQIDVGRRERANPMGEWVMGGGRSRVVEDERLRHEDDRVRAQAQRLMTWVLVGSAVTAAYVFVPFDRSVSGDVLAAWAWTLAALGLTLRQAIVLWSEDDPRESGDVELVMKEQEV